MCTSNKQSGSDEIAIEAFAEIPWEGRAVLLVDLDAFFASVEQLDHPGWRGKPVIVGGGADKRGVVSTASYEAREYGVHSAMPSSAARRLCPEAIWTEGHFSRYREMSNKVMQILFDETPHVQQVSIDEAFLDVTPTKVNREHPVVIARRIQDRVSKLGITCSIGVGTTKSIAKMASDMDKPRGLTVVLPGSELNFIDPLPVKALSGIGHVTELKLKELGIETLGELYRAESSGVMGMLGKNGGMLLERIRGLEDGDIGPDESVKSVSNEISFASDLSERVDIEASIEAMASKVGRRLRRKGLKGKTLTLKIKYSDFKGRSTQIQLDEPCDSEYVFNRHLRTMLDEVWTRGMSVRLVGVAVSSFSHDDRPDQLELFSMEDERLHHDEGRSELLDAADKVKDRFGENALKFGRELRLSGRDTGSSAKSPADYR